MTSPDTKARFWSKVNKTDTCWLWTATTVQGRSPDRQGRFWLNGRMQMAYRVAYEMCVGPIPKGLTIDHLCRQPLCVKPEHLRPLTLRENILCGTSPSAIAAKKTHCPKGHLLDRVHNDGDGKHRYCSICHSARMKTRNQ